MGTSGCRKLFGDCMCGFLNASTNRNIAREHSGLQEIVIISKLFHRSNTYENKHLKISRTSKLKN
jgi:hypothetical protein